MNDPRMGAKAQRELHKPGTFVFTRPFMGITHFISLPLILLFFFAFLLPYLAALGKAFNSGAPGGISVWQNPSLLRITLFTLKQAFLSVLLSLAIGLPGAWFIGSPRSNPVLRTITAIPFAMPSILVVLSFVLFFGNSGWLNRFLSVIPGIGPLRILYKPQAIILAHAFLNFPIVIRLAGDGFERARKVYAPAAAGLGASPFISAITVILPLSLPAIMSSALLVFLYSFTSFAIVLVLGGGPSATTLAVEIYRHAKIFFNYQNAGALALVETLIALSIFITIVYFGKKSSKVKIDTEERIIDEKKNPLSKIIVIVYLAAAAIFILGPLLSIIVESFLEQTSRSAAQVLSIRWWRGLGNTCLPSLLRSLILAFFSASLACALSILAAASVKLIEGSGRENTPWVNFIRFFAAAPIVSSGIVLGLGWLIIYGGNLPPITLALLHGLIALPFAFYSISEGFRSLPANTLNAAAVSGASPLMSIISAALPLSLKRIRSAWGFSAALSMGELNAIMMLGSEKWETLPLYIFRAVGSYRYGTACAAGTLLLLCCSLFLLLSESGRKKYGS